VNAIKDLDAEIIVVDNASKDESSTMMKELFPNIRYIFLNENIGFSRGNNLGIKEAKGEYVLLLNPDTLIQDNTLTKCVDFLDQNINTGGLGVKMIDGYGKFLPESKRGLPTPEAAFYKIFGLSRLIPKSRQFGQYHLGFLDKDEIHEVDILSGAFMMMRRKALDEVGLLDETFFMYGEDIDLSYRITQGGYVNHYFPKTTIIHYKGESTKKGSLNYVLVFYRAMVIFARKHFDANQASLFNLLINLAIYFRAFLALLWRLIGRLWQLLIDFAIIYISFSFATYFYGDIANKDFALPLISVLLPIYSLTLSASLFFSGAHDLPFKIHRLIRGWFVGTLLLLALYSLLPEEFRFSRAVVLIGSAIAIILGFTWRFIASVLPNSPFRVNNRMIKRRLVLGDQNSFNTVQNILDTTEITNEFLAGISVDSKKPSGFLGTIDQLHVAISDFRIDELIIDHRATGFSRIIRLVEKLKSYEIEVKILNNDWLVGPNQIIRQHRFKLGNKLFEINLRSIQRKKRINDLLFSLILLLISPLAFMLIDNKAGFFKNIAHVLFGKKTWVGYDKRGLDPLLPVLKPGVLHENMESIWPQDQEGQAFNANVKYLYSNMIFRDAQLISRHFQNLGKQ
jgi:O-antigen biosynthesis protein